MIPGGSDSEESACNVGDQLQSLVWEDPLEKEMATHSSILAWKIPEVEEPLSSRRTAVHAVVKSQAQLSDFHT